MNAARLPLLQCLWCLSTKDCCQKILKHCSRICGTALPLQPPLQNPDPHPAGAPAAGPDAEYDEEQQKEFSGRSWIGVEDRSLLDVAGTELLLVGAKADPIESGARRMGPRLMAAVISWSWHKGHMSTSHQVMSRHVTLCHPLVPRFDAVPKRPRHDCFSAASSEAITSCS